MQKRGKVGSKMADLVKVAVDAMGGDNAPGEIVKGAVDAVSKRSDIQVLLTGQELSLIHI